MRPALEAIRNLMFDTVVCWTSYSHTEFFVDIRDVDAAIDAIIAACPKP